MFRSDYRKVISRNLDKHRLGPVYSHRGPRNSYHEFAPRSSVHRRTQMPRKGMKVTDFPPVHIVGRQDTPAGRPAGSVGRKLRPKLSATASAESARARAATGDG